MLCLLNSLQLAGGCVEAKTQDVLNGASVHNIQASAAAGMFSTGKLANARMKQHVFYKIK